MHFQRTTSLVVVRILSDISSLIHMTWLWYSCISDPYLEIKTVVMFLSRSSTVSQQESFSGSAYFSKWATASFFKLMHSARYSSKWDKTHGLAVIWLVQKCWEMLGGESCWRITHASRLAGLCSYVAWLDLPRWKSPANKGTHTNLNTES